METHNSEELIHYGVLGMRWGVRKQPETGTGSAVKSKEEKAKIQADRAAELQAKIDRKEAEKAAKKAAKKAASAAKKAANKAVSSAKKASGKKSSESSAEKARKKAEAARKKIENKRIREAREAERKKNKEAREAERKKKKEAREAEKRAKEEDKKAKADLWGKIPKGGLTKSQRAALAKSLSTSDLIEQNKRLQLEKTNSELKAKLAEYEKANRSQFAKLADTFVSEASSNLTKYAAKRATDMLIGAIDSNLSTGSIKALAKEANRATGLSDIVRKKDKK
jgi:colicin import membrane protein|nr:MAG TPA: hypothetical protein [Caudoviricetes sp.]